MISSLDGGSRMEGESAMHNDNSFLADTAPAPSQVTTSPLRQRIFAPSNRISASNPVGSQLSSIMEGSQGEVTMSVSAWAQTAAAAPEDSKLDSAFGQADEACSSADRLAAGESLLSDSAVIVPSRTAVRGRTRGALHVKKSETGVGQSEPVRGTRGGVVNVAPREDGIESPRFVPMDMSMGDNSSMLEAPAVAKQPKQSAPGASQSTSIAPTQRSGTLQPSRRGSRSTRIPRASSVSSSADDSTPRAATSVDAPPAAPSTNSRRRMTDLFLPTSPSLAGRDGSPGSPGSSALGSATSGVDADISAALDDESSMNFVGAGSKISSASFKHPPGVRQVGKGRLKLLGIARGTPKTTPRDSIASGSAMLSTPSRNEDGSELKSKTSHPNQRSSGAHWQEQSSDAMSSSFCEPEGVEDDMHSPVKVGSPAQKNVAGSRASHSSNVKAPTFVRTAGSSGSNSGTSGPSHTLRKLGSGSPVTTGATDPASALHDSLQPPPTPDKSLVPGAHAPTPTKLPQASQASVKLAYAKTADLISTDLKSIRKKSNTISSLGDSQLRKDSEGVKRKAKSRTLSAYEIARMVESNGKRGDSSLPILKNLDGTTSVHVHAMKETSGDGMQTIPLPSSTSMFRVVVVVRVFVCRA